MAFVLPATSAEQEKPLDADGAAQEEEREEDAYLMTLSHCFLSRKATLHGASNIEFKGRTVVEADCVMHGDVSSIKLGRYVWIGRETMVHPPLMNTSDGRNKQQPVPVSIGSHTRIESNCDIRAAALGSFCWIGKRVRLGQRVIVKDCCVIQDDVVLGDDTVIPPFTLVSKGPRVADSSLPVSAYAPSFYCTELPPSTSIEIQERSIQQYSSFASPRMKL